MGELLAGYDDAKKNKRRTASALGFEFNLQANLAAMHEAIVGGTYTPGPSIVFVVARPKKREVFAARFDDRVVHHAWFREIAPRFERTFIADSCACIKGRGTLYAARRLEQKVRSVTRNWSRPAYYLKCDVRSCFPSIDKRRLLGMLFARIPEPFWRDLTKRIILNDPRVNVEVHGAPERLALIPPAKSLFGRPAHLGLPIGNLPSQFCVNVYLDRLDQFIKHRLRVRPYVRYVDDFVLLGESPAVLNAHLAAIRRFLAAELGLQLAEEKTILQPIERGLDFAGQLIKPWRRIVRPRTMRAALARLETMPENDVYEAGNSYLGLARQASHGWRDRTRIANAARRRGHAVDHPLTKVYP